MKDITATIVRQQQHLAARFHAFVGGHRERGDVPGWVLITLMTAGMVTAIWLVAGPQLTKLFQDAISSVKGPK